MIDGVEVDAITKAWQAYTAGEGSGWTADVPSRGQCAPTALVVQDLAGGEILRGRVDGVWHFWNLLADGVELDLTLQQFGEEATYDDDTPPEVVTREYMLGQSNLDARYTRLKQRVKARLFVTMFLNVRAELAEEGRL